MSGQDIIDTVLEDSGRAYFLRNRAFFAGVDTAVLVFADPGAARVLSVFGKILKDEGLFTAAISTGWAERGFFDSGERFNQLAWEDLDFLAKKSKVLIIYGARSEFGKNYELVAFCRRSSISTLFLFDSWKNYRINFYDNSHGELFLPDRVAVIDDLGKAALLDGLADCLPHGYEANIDVIGQLALHASMQYMETLGPRRLKRLKQKYNPEGKTLHLFLTEPIRKDFFQTNALDPGYDEFSVLAYYLDHCHGRRTRSLIKLHPRQDRGDLDLFFRQHQRFIGYDYQILSNERVEHLIAIADYIYGITSVALNLAVLAGKRIMSLQIGRNSLGRSLSNPILERYVVI